MGIPVWIAGEEARHGNYARAIAAAGGIPFFQGTPETCAALVLPGGGDISPERYGEENTASRNIDPEREARDWELLEQFTAAGKPVVGICRGMQCINVFFGGSLYQDIPGHGQKHGADRFHAVRTAPGAFPAEWGTRVNSAHHQAVRRLGDGLTAVQWAEDGIVEALCHERFPVWGVQWHPERLPLPAGPALFRAFVSMARPAEIPFAGSE